MDWAGVLKAFLEVGILGLCAVTIIITYKQNHDRSHIKDDEKDKRIDKKDDKNEQRFDNMLAVLEAQNRNYQDQLSEQVKILTNTIINGIINHVPSDEESAKISRISESIDVCLHEILQETNADRVALVQYHNRR